MVQKWNMVIHFSWIHPTKSQVLGVVGILIILCLFFQSVLPLKAATRTWDGGGGDTNWSTCANWSTDTCPVAADTVIFDGTSTKDSVIDASAPASISVFTISSGYTGSITVARTFSISTYSQADGSFSGSNQALTFAALAQSGGSFTASSGTTIINSTFNVSGGTFAHNTGTVRFSGSTATLTCNSVVFNVVSFTGQTNTKTVGSTCALPLGAAPTIPNPIVLNGTLSGSGTLTINDNLTLNSTASLSGFSGLNHTSGILTLSNYAESFSTYSPFTVGAITVSAGNLTLPATVSSGTVTMSSGILNAPSTLWTITGGMSLSGTASLVHNNGTITFTGALNPTITCNSQTFNLVNISWTGNGGSTISSNCNFPLGNNPTITNGSNSRAFNLNGTLSGTGTLTFSSSAGTTMTISSTGLLSGFSGLSMAGITVAGASIDLSTYSPLSMGTLIVSSGSLTVPSGLTMTGALQVTGGTFNAPSGTLTVGSNLSVTGSPTFNNNGGTISLNGTSPTVTCTGTIFSKVVIASSSSTTIGSGCVVPLGTDPTVLNDVVLNGTLTGTGTLTHNYGGLTVQNGGTLTGFSELIGSFNALTVTSTTLNLSAFTRVQLGDSFVLSNSSSHISAPQLLELGSGVSLSGGTFTHNGGTVNFYGGAASITCSTQTFSLITFSGQTGTKSFTGCALPLGNNPTIPLSVTTNGTLSGSGTLTHTAGVLTLNTGASLSGFSGLTGTSNALTVEGATANFSTFTTFSINGTTQLNSGTITFPNNAAINGNLIIAGATLASTTGDITISGNVTASSGTINAPSGLLTIGGALTFSGTANFVHNSGTVNFTGSGVTLACNSKAFNLVTFNNTGTLTVQSTCAFPLGNNPTIPTSITLNGTLSGSGTLTMTTGTFTLGSTASLSGFSGFSGSVLTTSLATFDTSSYSTFTTSGLVTVSAGTLTLPANASIAGLTLSSSSNLGATPGDLTITGALTMSGSGTLTAPTGTLYLSGNFVHTSGTYTHNNGTINFNGGSQTLSGIATSFYNVTKQLSSATAQTLTFPGSVTVTTTVNGTLTLAGYDTSNRLSLRSSNATQFRLSPLGSSSLLYLDLNNANNVSGTTIQMGGTGSLDSTNNTNFNFDSLTPNDPTSLGPSDVISAVTVGTTTPTFTFTLSDPNPLDTMYYQLQISQVSDFSSPVVDYSSALGTQGSKSFTVGQSAGTGTYTTGSSGQTLSTGNYYWRVRAYDNSGLVSNYVAGNGGSMAFAVDAQAPASFNPTLNVNSPTTDTTPIVSFSTTDNVAVDYYRVKINSGAFSTQSSPYQLPTLAEGFNTITVRAYDTSNNYTDGQVTIVVDYSQPDVFTPTLNVTSPSNNVTPTVSFTTTDNDGIGHYEVKVDSGAFTTQTSPYLVPTLAEGSRTITVRAYDTAGNYRDGSVSITIDSTAPNSFTPTLNVTSPTADTQPIISFSTTDTIAVSYYQVKVDDGSYSTRTSPYQLPTLSIGDHTITVKAVDTAGNERTGWVDITVTAATDEPPFAFTPTFLPAAFTTSTTPQVVFSTTDDRAVSYYEVQVDSGAFSQQTSPYQLPTLSEGAHRITVRAYDDADQMTVGSATITVDLSSPAAFTPTFSVSSPTNDATPTLTFSTTDTVGIDHYEIRVDSGSFVTHSSPYTIPTVADGDHVVTVRAYDAAGNYSESSASIQTDATQPAAFTPTLNVSSPTANQTPILSFSTTDANGVVSYQLRVDGGSFSTQTSPYQFSTLSEGSHTVTVRAFDSVGNSRDASITFDVDLAGPEAFTPTFNVQSPTQNTTPILSFSTTDTDGIDHYEVSVDSGAFSAQSSPYTLSTLSQGSHTIRVRAYDTLGNMTEESVTMIIDTTGPTISITASDKVNNTDISDVQLSVSDSNGVDVEAVTVTGATKSCTQQSATIVSCTLTVTTSGTITVEAQDHAGNQASSSVSDFVIETVAPVLVVTAPTKVTKAAITDTEIVITDNYGLTASAVTAVSGGTIACTQDSVTQVTCQATIRYTGSLVINVLDLAGNAGAHTETGYEIDNTPPAAFTLTLNTELETTNSSPILFFATTDTDGIDYYLVRLDSNAFSRQISPYQLSSLSAGSHTLTVQAYDIYGNFTQEEISMTILGSSPTPTPTPTPTTSTSTSTPSPTPTAIPDTTTTPTPTSTTLPTQSTIQEQTVLESSTGIQPTPTSQEEPFPDGVVPTLVSQIQTSLLESSLAARIQSLPSNVIRVMPAAALGSVAVTQVVGTGILLSTASTQVGLGAVLHVSTVLNILSAVGVLPIKKRHGYVHNVVNGAPIPFAIISIQQSQSASNIQATTVSDMYGRYQEPALPIGTYSMQVTHPNFNFPPKQLRPLHLCVDQYYAGEKFTINSARSSRPLIIPMESRLLQTMESTLRSRLLLFSQRILIVWKWIKYPLALFSILHALLAFSPLALGIGSLYGLMLAIDGVSFFRRPTIHGQIILENTSTVLRDVIVTLSRHDGSVVALSKSDPQGMFSFFVPQETYLISAVSSMHSMVGQEIGSVVEIQPQNLPKTGYQIAMQEVAL